LLLTCPPCKAKRWTEEDIDPSAEAELARLFDRLYELQPTAGDGGQPRPALVRQSGEAKAAWRANYNAHAIGQADLTGDMAVGLVEALQLLRPHLEAAFEQTAEGSTYISPDDWRQRATGDDGWAGANMPTRAKIVRRAGVNRGRVCGICSGHRANQTWPKVSHWRR
jgi:hypothetical protein